MVRLQDMDSPTGGGGRLQEQAINTAVDGIADLEINDAVQDGAEATLSLDEGRTLTVDPNLLAPWDAGYGGAPDDPEEDKMPKNPQAPHPETNDQIDPPTDKARHLPAAEESPAAGESVEIGVGSSKKKSKSKKKPKSKRGLVRTYRLAIPECMLTQSLSTDSTNGV